MAMLACIQCAMEDLLADRDVRQYDETIEEHMKRCHADPFKDLERRKELERLLAIKLRRETP